MLYIEDFMYSLYDYQINYMYMYYSKIILLRLVHNTLACDVMQLERHIK